MAPSVRSTHPLVSSTLLALAAACSDVDHATTAPPALPATQVVSSGAYTAIDLGTLGGLISHAWAINDEGTIAGFSTLPDGSSHLFLRRAGRQVMEDIGWPTGMQVSQIGAINVHDVIVGTLWIGGNSRAFQWSSTGGYVALATLGGDHGLGSDVNIYGEIVGAATLQPGGTDYHAVLWRPGQAPLDLGTLGGRQSFAEGINDRGVVVGMSLNAGGLPRAFRWTPQSGMQDIGAPGVANDAKDISNGGVVTGPFQLGDGTMRTYRRTEQGFTEFGLYEGGRYMAPQAISSAGHIALLAITRTNDFSMLIHFRGALNPLWPLPGGRFPMVMDVNRCGHAVGYSTTSAGWQHAVLWTTACP
jgi:probable HAF family extracellular repeat protein